MAKGVELKIYIESTRVTQLLGGISGRVRNLRPWLDQVVGLLDVSVAKTWRTKGRGGWKPLSEWTKRARKGSSYTILWDTGRLRKSIGVMKLTAWELRYGTTVPYAPTHQFGRPSLGWVTANVPEHQRKITQAFGRRIPERTVTVRAHTRRMFLPAIPQRLFLAVWPEDLVKMKNILRLYIIQGELV